MSVVGILQPLVTLRSVVVCCSDVVVDAQQTLSIIYLKKRQRSPAAEQQTDSQRPAGEHTARGWRPELTGHLWESVESKHQEFKCAQQRQTHSEKFLKSSIIL